MSDLQKVVVRNVQSGDSEAVLFIRNLPSVYKYFRSAKKITKEGHADWFAIQQQPAKRKNFFVAEQDGKIIGYLRYDATDNICDISIAVIPEFRKKGIASLLLRQTLSNIAEDGKRIQAEVKKKNIESCEFFKKHGFTKFKERQNSIIFVFDKKNVLISGAGGSPFPYIFRALERKYNLFLIDANPIIKYIYPDRRIFVVPFANDRKYSQAMERMINKYQISYYIPLIDNEVLIANTLSKKYKHLKVIAPNLGFSSLCLDKYRLSKQLSELEISEIKTWNGNEFKNEIYPVFVKPKIGTGSRGGYKIDSQEQLKAYYQLVPYKPHEVIIQEYIDGEEYTVSVVANHQNQLIAIVPKRIIVKKGITIHAITEKNSLIEVACRKIVDILRPTGPFNVQLRILNEKVKIFEINPRFSTTSILTCEAGVNEFELCMNNYDSKSVKYIDNWKQGLHLFRRWESCFYEN